MKKLLTGLLLIIGLHSYSQCNCPNFEKEGKSITVCDIKPIAYDNSLQVGISYGKISTQPIVSMTIRYRSEVKNVNSNMTLTLSNGTILEIPLQKSGLAYIGNSQVCQAIFTVTEVQKAN